MLDSMNTGKQARYNGRDMAETQRAEIRFSVGIQTFQECKEAKTNRPAVVLFL